MDEKFMTVIQHEEYAKRMEDEHKRQNKRLDLLEENQRQIGDLTISVKEMAISMKQMLEEQKDQGERLDELESRDGEKWRKISTHAIALVVGAVITYILKQLGL